VNVKFIKPVQSQGRPSLHVLKLKKNLSFANDTDLQVCYSTMNLYPLIFNFLRFIHMSLLQRTAFHICNDTTQNGIILYVCVHRALAL